MKITIKRRDIDVSLFHALSDETRLEIVDYHNPCECGDSPR